MIEIIDTHQHLMYGDKFKYSWSNEIPALACADFKLEQYEQLAQKSNIKSSIFVETAVDDEFYTQEAKLCKSLINKNSVTQAIVAGCFPENDSNFDNWLEETKDKTYVGYRRVLHTMANDVSESATFIENIKKIGKINKTFDMCFLQSQLDLAINLAKKCPNTQLILDHCGIPEIATGNFKEWAKKIDKLAELENVACKISGLVTYCSPEQEPIEAIKPYVEYCIESFGWDRVVWGGDWPVVNLTKDLASWVDISLSLIANTSIDEQNKLLNKNAKNIYNLIEL